MDRINKIGAMVIYVGGGGAGENPTTGKQRRSVTCGSRGIMAPAPVRRPENAPAPSFTVRSQALLF